MPDPVNRTLLATRKAAYDEATAAAGAAAQALEDRRRERERARDDLIEAIGLALTVDHLTWKQIGDQLGVTAQAASQMYRRATLM